MNTEEILKQNIIPFIKFMHFSKKAEETNLSWRRPWMFFKWYYYMNKARSCIPKQIKMHRQLFDPASGPDETIWTCARCLHRWKSSEHAGPECSKCYAKLTRK